MIRATGLICNRILRGVTKSRLHEAVERQRSQDLESLTLNTKKPYSCIIVSISVRHPIYLLSKRKFMLPPQAGIAMR